MFLHVIITNILMGMNQINKQILSVEKENIVSKCIAYEFYFKLVLCLLITESDGSKMGSD